MTDNRILRAGTWANTPPQDRTNPPDRILVVEDDDSLRELSTDALIRSGYEVDAAADGAAAWDKLQHNRYDLMVTDNNMPKISGLELLKHLRAVRMELPVIMATGALPQEEFDRYPSLRPAATLLKPFTIEEMLQTVKKVLRKAVSTSAGPLQHPTHSAQRVLVVDGDHDLRWLYAEALVDYGCRVDAVADGIAGWDALQANRYDLLITEHELPKLTGVELVAKLRADHMTLPVVMAAGRLPARELAQDPSLQLAATLLKPFTVDTLLDTVKNVLARQTVSPSQSHRCQTDETSRQPLVYCHHNFFSIARVEWTGHPYRADS